MAVPETHSPVMCLLAAFSRYPQALDWTRVRAQSSWGPLALESPRFVFAETDYYEPSMGAGLHKQFFAFADYFSPAQLAARKLESAEWESLYAAENRHAEARPLNLDPGYLTTAKLVLASTKDHAHRIYLDRGIYAEVTLRFKHGAWAPWEWTFPDYRRTDYQTFFSACRDWYRQHPAGPRGG